MSNATICPEILICFDGMTPDVFDKVYMSVAAEHIKTCKSLDLPLDMCREVLDSVWEHFPWQHYQDNTWKQYLSVWITGVISELDRVSSVHVSLPDQASNNGNTFFCAIENHPCKQPLFQNWLSNWKEGQKYKDHYYKGIGTNPICNISNTITSNCCLCSEFQIITQSTEWKYLKYTWLLFYDKRLPINGKFPFQPQDNWMTLKAPPRGPQHGLFDSSGNEWCWDKQHGGHWDVQLKTSGDYYRVNQDGHIF